MTKVQSRSIMGMLAKVQDELAHSGQKQQDMIQDLKTRLACTRSYEHALAELIDEMGTLENEVWVHGAACIGSMFDVELPQVIADVNYIREQDEKQD